MVGHPLEWNSNSILGFHEAQLSQGNLFSGFLEEFWGCHPISTFREGLKKDKERALLKPPLLPSLLDEGRLLCLAFSSSMLVHASFCILFCVCFLCCLLACRGDLGGFHFVLSSFLGCIIEILLFVLRDFYMGVLGITHPWIGEKWPCGGGPQLDLIDESLLSWREEGERVGWYGTPTRQTMPYWYCEKD